MEKIVNFSSVIMYVYLYFEWWSHRPDPLQSVIHLFHSETNAVHGSTQKLI